MGQCSRLDTQEKQGSCQLLLVSSPGCLDGLSSFSRSSWVRVEKPVATVTTSTEVVLRHHAVHRHNRLVDLPVGLLLWLPVRCGERRHTQPGVQSRRLCQQDCVLLGDMGCGEELYCRGGCAER